MNETKHNIEISGAIIEQLSSLNEEEPTKYWRAGMKIIQAWRRAAETVIFTTERAAWLFRERELTDPGYASTGPPFQCTRDEATAVAFAVGATRVEVCDETGTVVDWWSVE